MERFQLEPNADDAKRQARMKRFAQDQEGEEQPVISNKQKPIGAFEDDTKMQNLSLDQLIRREGRQDDQAANSYELQQKIDKFKYRIEKYGGKDDEMKEHQLKKIQRMQKKLEWTEHKAFPLPIQLGSDIVKTTLYLYGVDFMSTQDVKNYFSRFCDSIEVRWINDSSCIAQFPDEQSTANAYNSLQLSQPRQDDELPSLLPYLQDLAQIQKQEKKKQQHNPDFDTLFGGQVETVQEDDSEEADPEIDQRNYEKGIGFIDVMGYKLKLSYHDRHTEPHQNLWVRYGCDSDKKLQGTLGKNSRYYKFENQNKRKVYKPKVTGISKKNRDIFTDHKKINLRNKIAQQRKQEEDEKLKNQMQNDENAEPEALALNEQAE